MKRGINIGKHTDGVLVVSKSQDYMCNTVLRLNGDYGVVLCMVTDFQDRAANNARRLAACWNACAGIPTEALESGVVEKMAEALSKHSGE